MKILTVTNLYPRPDDPARGVFNAALFRAMAAQLSMGSDGETRDDGSPPLINICLVPEWRAWRWRSIRSWEDPFARNLGTQYVPAFYVPVVGRDLSWRTYQAALRTVREWGGGRDGILATWLYPDAVAAAVFAEHEGLPLWIKVHGSDRFHLDRPARRNVILDACRRARGIISNCEFLAGQLAEAGISPLKMHVIPNGVDHGRFRPVSRDVVREGLVDWDIGRLGRQGRDGTESPNNPIPQSPNPQIVLYAGHLVPVKGPDRLLQAWKILLERRQHSRPLSAVPKTSDTPTPRHPDTSTHHSPPLLVILGDGPMRRQLEGMARSLGIADSVCFVGGRPHEEMALWMNLSDCLCLPSRSEGMPNVVLESLACGRPVVAANVGDVPRLVREGVDGVIVEDGPAFSSRFAGAIGRALDGDWDRDRISSGTNRFTWEKAAEDLLSVMRETASMNGGDEES
ncbi:MAG: glycosyltransferase [Lentisphaerae bacterium]|nr:glycosyltransferase [Lentisphaerota bacterium]